MFGLGSEIPATTATVVVSLNVEQNRHSRIAVLAWTLLALAAAVYVAIHLYGPVVAPILDVLPPFAIAFVFAFLLDPVVDWFERRRFSREFGVAIVGLAFIALFMVLVFVITPRVADQAVKLTDNLPAYSKQAMAAVNDLMVREKPLLERLNLPTTASELSARFSDQIEQAARRSLEVVAGALTSALSKLLWVIIIPLATLWLLKDLDYIKAKIVHFTPERHKERLTTTSNAVGGVFGKYVRGMLAVAIIYSAVSSIWLSAAGLDYALIIGGISGFLYLVPYIGALTTIAAVAVAALVQPGYSIGFAGLLVGAVAVQSFVIFDLLVTPKVVGGNVGVHPVLMLFSLALGARLFGVVGMVAAVPVAASIQVALGQYYPQIYDNLRRRRPEPEPIPPPDDAT